MMRTTLNLPDDIYEVARSLAASRQTSMGEALAELVRRGLDTTPRIDSTTVFPHFAVPKDAPPITLEKTFEADCEL